MDDITDVTALVEEATFDFAVGDSGPALEKLRRATAGCPGSFAAWHALAEVCFAERLLDEALMAAETAATLEPEDIHIHTSLSRIWMERGDKTRAETHGARARMLGWKEQLKEPPAPPRPDGLG